MRGLRLCATILTLVLLAMASEAQDLHIKKNVSVGGYVASTMETSIKGARTRDVTTTAGASTITLRQCDLKQSVTINEQAQTYYVAKDPQDAAAARAAALATGAPVAESTGGKITVTSTVTDTGERKTMYGFPARHLKIKVTEESSEKACSQVHQNFDIDGWYADVSKEMAGCNVYVPAVQQTQGCHDEIVEKHSGSGKPGYPLSQTLTMPSPDGPTTVTIAVSEISKQPLDKALFDVPEGYKQVSSLADLRGVPQMAQAAAAPGGAAQAATWGQQPQTQAGGVPPGMNGAAQNPRGQMNPGAMNPQAMMSQAMMSQAMAQQGMANPYAARGGMPGMPASQATGAPIALPQALGPKAPGMIRIGVAPPDAQVGQGSNAGGDYSTPIRNAMILLMAGPAVEVAALDSHVPLQLQAEAQQKQCDYILFSSVVLKHNAGGFGKFAKMGSMAASMTPMGMMAHGMGSAVAASAASAAAQAAQQQAMSQVMSQLQGFNGQIKSKDDVSVQYQLMAPGQSAPVLQNALQGKAKSDGEDVLTPLLQQTANTVVGQVGKK